MRRTSSALLLCTALMACKHGGGGVSDAGKPTSFTPSKRPNTHAPEISINNLDGQIADADKRAHVGERFFRDRYPELILERAGYLGITGDFDAADDASAANVGSDPNDGSVRLMRARVLGAIHKFSDALTELDVAAAHGASGDDMKRARATIFLATGRCAEAASMWPAMPYATDMAMRGAMEQRLGHPQLAETLFERARLEYDDISPLRFGWMDFERARAFEREGDPVRAKAYLEDALAAFPQYAHAAVHVAVLETPDRALEYLDHLDKRADDPDIFSARADALRRSSKDAEAHAMTERARGRYEEVLAKHPEAYADHAARFFLGAGGDVKRALVLAKGAASRAPSEETLELWLLAARAASSNDEMCAAVAAAAKTTCPLRGSAAQFELARKTCK